MVSLPQLREYMKRQAEADREKKSVQVTGVTIEEALEQASIELGVPVRKIEYEVLEKGSKGTFGLGKKDFLLIAYPVLEEDDIQSFEESLGFDEDLEDQGEIEIDKNGEVIIRLAPEGVFLKVTSPVGKGKKAGKKDAFEALKQRDVQNIDELMVASAVKQADGQFIKVGDFEYNPVNDAIMAVEILDAEMTAKMTVQPPGKGGADLSFDTMISFLKNNSVVHGIQEDVLRQFEEFPLYNEPVIVAEGTKPQNGEDAKILYNFEIEKDKVTIKEIDGKVDFKELNKIQNIVEGQILAKKVPAQEGTDGRTVTGRLLPAKPGKDVEMGVGKNTKLSEDGSTLTAECNGQVLLINGKVNVEPIYVVEGDINMKVGNIVHLGTVIVKGNVDDGFKLKASGNIEIMGTVGKSEIDAEGDIIVHQGITGKTGGKIKSGKSVWSKFIENAIVEVEENVIASDGIINSKVDANNKIVCLGRGKRAKIVGGHLRAAEEIIAETIGSTAGSETICEVGYDPKSKERFAELESSLQELNADLEETNLNITTLAKIKKVKRTLPEEKEKYLKDLIEKKNETENEIKSLSKEMDQLQEYLASLKFKGRVSASKQVLPGVKIYIKDAMLEVRNDFKSVTFINENNMVKVTKFVEPEEDFSRR